MFQFTPEASLTFSKFSIILTSCWPPSLNASKLEIFIRDVVSFLAFISAFCLLIPLLCSVYQDRGDSLVMLQSMFISCGVSLLASKIIICRVHRYNLQVLANKFKLNDDFRKIDTSPETFGISSRIVSKVFGLYAILVGR